MEDTNWSFPVEILKEDTITIMLRNWNGDRKFLRLEIRGYEEGSRFLIVLRPASTRCPVRYFPVIITNTFKKGFRWLLGLSQP